MPKQDLVFPAPVLNAAGTLGFAPDGRGPVDWAGLGAFVTNPISLRARRPVNDAAIAQFAGGVLVHSGLPNPGLRRILQQYTRIWEQSPLPIIAHLMADRPEETREMVRALEGIDSVLAVELGFAPLLADDLIQLAVDMSLGELPIIVSLPADQCLRLGPRLIDRGAAALGLAAPRGAAMVGGRWLSGRLMGASLLPLSLELVRDAYRLGLPIIGCGGVRTSADIGAMLDCGAIAVELDLGLWLPGPITKSPVA